MLEELYKRVSRTLSTVLTVAIRIPKLQTKLIEAENLCATQAVPRQDHNPRNTTEYFAAEHSKRRLDVCDSTT